MARIVRLFLVMAFLASCSSGSTSSTSNLNNNDNSGIPGDNDQPAYTGGLIIDHRAVVGFDRIPSGVLDQVKALTIHYAHTSHGGQIIEGAEALEAASSTYNLARRQNGSTVDLPPQESPAALRMYDGNAPLSDYVTPDLYWDGDTGMTATRGVADTGLFDFSMWSWCGQQSSNDSDTVQRYLDNLNTLETEYPGMRFIYMTGHTDGTGTSGTLNTNNNIVRQYVSDHSKVLFDFADIESWDPAGNFYPNTGNPDGACNWCDAWCNAHPADCADLTGGCAHTHPYNCKLKAKAFWYMMARLTGWNDPDY